MYPNVRCVYLLFSQCSEQCVRQFIGVFVQFEVSKHVNGSPYKCGWIGEVLACQCSPCVSGALR